MLQRTEELHGVLKLVLASCCPPDATADPVAETDIRVETLEDATKADSAHGLAREAGGKVGFVSTLAPALQVRLRCAVPLVACSSHRRRYYLMSTRLASSRLVTHNSCNTRSIRPHNLQGHSFGAATALLFSKAHPVHVTGLHNTTCIKLHTLAPASRFDFISAAASHSTPGCSLFLLRGSRQMTPRLNGAAKTRRSSWLLPALWCPRCTFCVKIFSGRAMWPRCAMPCMAEVRLVSNII